MKLLIVRHGKTLNLEKWLFQRPNSPLSDTGIEEAKRVAEKLKNKKIDIIYVSPLLRAQQTLEAIQKYHKGVPVLEDERIQERSFGKWKWIHKRKLIALYPWKTTSDSDLSDIYEIDPDVEHSDSLMIRAKDFLDEIKKKHKDDTVLVVAHRQINSALIYTIQNKPYGKYMDLKNGAVEIFEI